MPPNNFLKRAFKELALDEIDRQAAERRLLVLRLHVGAGLAHRGDDAVQRYPVAAVAVERERGGRDRLDRAKALRSI
jgi:hypothetical protein